MIFCLSLCLSVLISAQIKIVTIGDFGRLPHYSAPDIAIGITHGNIFFIRLLRLDFGIIFVFALKSTPFANQAGSNNWP